MSVTDPLIKELKGHTSKFLEVYSNNSTITDSYPHLIPFCTCLERIFACGIVSPPNSFGFIRHNDPWTWIEKVASVRYDLICYNFVSAVENARDCKNVFTNTGRFRLLVRYCLVRKCLHVPVEHILSSGRISKIYDANSILGDEILREIFLSVLYQCGKISFKLDILNTSFLDLSWILPEVVRVELVPAHHLGMSISFAGEKAIIVRLRSNSVSGECTKICVGDVLENLNGVCICAATQGRLSSLLKCQKGRPTDLTIVKAIYSHTHQYYPPMIKLLKDVNLDPDVVKSKSEEKHEEEELSFDEAPVPKKNRSGFKSIYVGSVEVGRSGDVKLIDKAFGSLFAASPSHSLFKGTKVKSDVIFEVGELGVRTTCLNTNKELLKHSFMDISACGSISLMPNYYAYIAGNEICTTSKSFKCYFFMAPNPDVSYTILQGIGQGFHRTHFAV